MVSGPAEFTVAVYILARRCCSSLLCWVAMTGYRRTATPTSTRTSGSQVRKRSRRILRRAAFFGSVAGEAGPSGPGCGAAESGSLWAWLVRDWEMRSRSDGSSAVTENRAFLRRVVCGARCERRVGISCGFNDWQGGSLRRPCGGDGFSRLPHKEAVSVMTAGWGRSPQWLPAAVSAWQRDGACWRRRPPHHRPPAGRRQRSGR